MSSNTIKQMLAINFIYTNYEEINWGFIRSLVHFRKSLKTVVLVSSASISLLLNNFERLNVTNIVLINCLMVEALKSVDEEELGSCTSSCCGFQIWINVNRFWDCHLYSYW